MSADLDVPEAVGLGAGVVTKRRGFAGRSRAKRWRQEQPTWAGFLLSGPFIVAAALLIVYPFIRLLITAFGEPDGLGNFTSYFQNGANLHVLRITFMDAAIVTVIAVTFGSIVAWSLRTTRSRAMKMALLAGIFVPFWMGSVVKLYSFTVILERLGLVNRVLIKLHIVHEPLNLLYNQLAVEIGMTYQMLPYAVLPLYVGFLSIDLDLIRAAESLGASRIHALRSVVAPLALPATLATVTIVYVVSIGFYLTPVLLGGDTAPFTASLISQNIFQFYDLAGAAVSAVILLVGALIIISLGYLVVGKERLARALG
jgi:ABC-type spermidine/putrescine transport system permease subunit I